MGLANIVGVVQNIVANRYWKLMEFRHDNIRVYVVLWRVCYEIDKTKRHQQQQQKY